MSTKTEEASLLRDLEVQIAELRRRHLEPLETGRFQIRERGEDVTRLIAASFREILVGIEAALIHARASKPENRAVLPARPVEGEIDHVELSREHMARYPKIRAALAE